MVKTEKAAEGQVKARVLTDCEHGKPNDVCMLSADVCTVAQEHGLVDASAEAVAYAESIAPADAA